MRRGEIYWADVSPRSGSEQTGRRPVLVVSHDGFNQAPGWRSVIVVPLTTSLSATGRGPTAVPLPEGTGGLEKASIALCHQVTTLDRSKLTRLVGAVPSVLLRRVSAGLRAAMDLEFGDEPPLRSATCGRCGPARQKTLERPVDPRREQHGGDEYDSRYGDRYRRVGDRQPDQNGDEDLLREGGRPVRDRFRARVDREPRARLDPVGGERERPAEERGADPPGFRNVSERGEAGTAAAGARMNVWIASHTESTAGTLSAMNSIR